MSFVSPRKTSILPLPLSSPLRQLPEDLITLLSRKKVQKAGLWMVTAWGVTVMTTWHWQLTLATGMGISTMLMVYHWQRWQILLNWQDWQKYLEGYQGKLTLAVSSGGLIALSTYIATSIWSDPENRWLALGTLIQGVGTSATLGILLWYLWQKERNPQETPLEKLLNDLTAKDPLKRLIALRKLIKRRNHYQLSDVEYQELYEYLTLMLNTESEPLIRQVLLESLLPMVKTPIPITLKQKEPFA